MYEKRLEDPSYMTLWALSVIVPYERFRRRSILFWLTVASVIAGYVFFAIWKIEGVQSIESMVVHYFVPAIFMTIAIAVTMFCVLVILIWPFATSFGIVLPIAMIVGGIGLLAYELYGYLTTGSWSGFVLANLWSDGQEAAGGVEDDGSLALLTKALGWTPAFVVLIFGGVLWITMGEDRVKKMGGQLIEEYRQLQESRDDIY